MYISISDTLDFEYESLIDIMLQWRNVHTKPLARWINNENNQLSSRSLSLCVFKFIWISFLDCYLRLLLRIRFSQNHHHQQIAFIINTQHRKYRSSHVIVYSVCGSTNGPERTKYCGIRKLVANRWQSPNLCLSFPFRFRIDVRRAFVVLYFIRILRQFVNKIRAMR